MRFIGESLDFANNQVNAKLPYYFAGKVFFLGGEEIHLIKNSFRVYRASFILFRIDSFHRLW